MASKLSAKVEVEKPVVVLFHPDSSLPLMVSAQLLHQGANSLDWVGTKRRTDDTRTEEQRLADQTFAKGIAETTHALDVLVAESVRIRVDVILKLAADIHKSHQVNLDSKGKIIPPGTYSFEQLWHHCVRNKYQKYYDRFSGRLQRYLEETGMYYVYAGLVNMYAGSALGLHMKLVRDRHDTERKRLAAELKGKVWADMPLSPTMKYHFGAAIEALREVEVGKP